MIQYLYWATQKGEPWWMEELVLVSDEKVNMEELEKLLEEKGYDRVRESILDLRQKPDFRKAVKI